MGLSAQITMNLHDEDYDCEYGPYWFNPSASTNCSNSTITFTFVDNITGTNCAGDIITRTWTATDNCGNSATGDEVMTAEDIRGPAIEHIYSSRSYRCSSGPNWNDVFATDNCNNNPSLTFTEQITGATCAGDVIRRIYTCVDDCGNSSSGY